MNPNRFFHISYFYKTGRGEEGLSSVNLESLSFPNEKYLKEVISEKIRKMLDIDETVSVHVSLQSFNEFRNQKDYRDFLK